MRIDILTLFPSMFSPLEESIIGKAKSKQLLSISMTNIRDFAKDKHNTADDTPYGGGVGMVMKPDLILAAIASLKPKKGSSKVILMSPSGRRLDERTARRLAKCSHIILICGHYEGIDQRVIDKAVDEEISIGDYVVTGGELPAMVLIDAVARFIPGVLGARESSEQDSFSQDLLEYPQYTKPAECSGLREVPEVLKSGDHKKISQWRRSESIKNTFFKRPDLLAKAQITKEDSAVLEGIFK